METKQILTVTFGSGSTAKSENRFFSGRVAFAVETGVDIANQRTTGNKKQQRIRYHLKNPAPNLHPLYAVVGAGVETAVLWNQISYFTSLGILLNESKFDTC